MHVRNHPTMETAPLPRLARLAAALFAALLATLVVVQQRRSEARYRADTAEAVELLPDGLTESTVWEIGREPDPVRRRSLLARALFAHEANPSWMANLSSDEAVDESQRSRRRLAVIQELARQVLAEQPVSYQAEMFLGGAAFLRLLRDTPAAAWSARDEWEIPLHRAMRLAPGAAEPVRLLAAAYLTVWSRLSDSRRSAARELLREAFQEPDTFGKLLDLWLSVASSPEEAISIVPDETFVWSRLLERHARLGDPERWVSLYHRFERARRARLGGLLEEARSRARLGDAARASAVYQQVLSACPIDRSYLPIAVAALVERPAGPTGRSFAETAEKWLRWNERLELLGGIGLPPAAIQRMISSLGNAAPVDLATAHLLAGNLADAERIERRADASWSEEWASYLVLKAIAFLERGEPEEAREALRLVHRNWRQTLPYWLVLQELGLATGLDEDRILAEQGLASWRRRSWEGTDWRWERRQPYLELLSEVAGVGLELVLDEAQERMVIEAIWDGMHLSPQTVDAGAVRWSTPIDPGAHRLELRFPLGGKVLPGELRIAEGAAAGDALAEGGRQVSDQR